MRRLGLIIAVASAAACAGYTVIYLYRWEWHRALMAGIFLVVAEVALATMAILRRLAALDARLDALAAAPPADRPTNDVLGHLRETAPPPRPVFAWLSPDGSTTNVFLPILLGAGVLASAAAWVVETLARATARPALERRLATRLGALALPAGGLLGPPAAVAAPPHRTPRLLWRAMISMAVVWGFGLGIGELADATQSRPHQARTGIHTIVELELRGELAAAIPERVVTSLWQSCAGTLRRGLPEPVVTDLGGGRFRLDLPADLGVSISRRIHGCLEDAGLDRVQARVVRLTSSPAA